MLECRFWKFLKKLNSTKLPSQDYLSLQIELTQDTNISSPVIRVWYGRTEYPDFNYCYIPAFQRHYFISRWEYVEHAVWNAYCYCDVLGTYKPEIGDQYVYVVRSASASDMDIVDELFPTTGNVYTSMMEATNPWLYSGAVALGQGVYIVGIDTQNGDIGSLNYYVLTGSDLSKLCYYLSNDFVSVAHDFNLTDASVGLQNSLVQPMQYIKSCIWYPIGSDNFTQYPLEQLYVGWTQVVYSPNSDAPVTGRRITGAPVYEPAPILISTVDHPQLATHGAYMNNAPFTQVQLSLPPIGIIDLDPNLLRNLQQIRIYPHIDLICGNCVFEVEAGTNIIHRLNGKLGVNIQLSQWVSDYIGTVTSASNAIGSLFKGDFLGALSGIGNTVSSAAPKVQSVGSNGGFTDLYGVCALIYNFYIQVEVDAVHQGRPLMQTKKINTLSGYIKADVADLEIECPADELQEVISYITSGFYYE